MLGTSYGFSYNLIRSFIPRYLAFGFWSSLASLYEIASDLCTEESLELAKLVPGGELLEGLAAFAMREVGAKHLFERRFELFDRDSLEELPPNRLLFPKTPADEHMITFFGFTRDFDRCAEQADITNIMLRA
jgi:hypothetical protein